MAYWHASQLWLWLRPLTFIRLTFASLTLASTQPVPARHGLLACLAVRVVDRAELRRFRLMHRVLRRRRANARCEAARSAAGGAGRSGRHGARHAAAARDGVELSALSGRFFGGRRRERAQVV